MNIQAEKKVCCITGAAHRIGACIAQKFHQQGFNVIIHYNRSADAAELLVSQLNQLRSNSAVALQADMNDTQQMKTLASRILDQYQRLDVLVNNASSFYPTPLGEATQSQWDELIDSNLRAAFFLSQDLSAELIRRQGAIVNIADTHADKPLLNYSIYSIAKAGLKAMTKSLANELAPSVRVNAVSPGAIIWPAALEDAQAPSVLSVREKILQQIPLGKLGEPKHIADTVYFLASEASYITGQTIRVDGGRGLS
jgi:pteridine reductase